jgi:hypothetical protein
MCSPALQPRLRCLVAVDAWLNETMKLPDHFGTEVPVFDIARFHQTCLDLLEYDKARNIRFEIQWRRKYLIADLDPEDKGELVDI